ncbi:hypothetical protein AUC68_03825 [Methyloceanibacter methanicus]|uniref:TfoX N-terminal domain-containing protein n=1 Tax=Methyloceanibacter methanicus TaxID=1774968 RepID=A0A1E3W088_9HYPH|nr:TfoX/Sxy family protein [Methyloceanibacter methanicus]ODR99163.1 hypothetical protein AUC68_03825 [Methyloceanibacter methanicus]
MSASEGFQEFVKDQLADFGPVAIRRMFGGAGVYAGQVMFALIADDTLYLKADGTTAPAFEAEGMAAFTYAAKGGKPISMSYWEVPPRLLEEPDELAAWAREAYAIARAAKKPARKKAAKNKTAAKKKPRKRTSSP